jgi:hypothetical protein
VLEFVKDDVRIAMTLEVRPSDDAAFALTQRVLASDSTAARAAILQRFSRTSAEIRRVDRIDAKLMTRAEFEQGSNNAGTSTSPNTDPNQSLWVVAIGGDVLPQFSRGLAFTWGIYLVSADNGDILGMLAGPGPWPPYFDSMPNRAGAVPTGPASSSGMVETGEIAVCPGLGLVGARVRVEARNCADAGAEVHLVFIGNPGETNGTVGSFSLPPAMPDGAGRVVIDFTVATVLSDVHGEGGGPTRRGTYRIISKPLYCGASFKVT